VRDEPDPGMTRAAIEAAKIFAQFLSEKRNLWCVPFVVNHYH
jgi:hypothetical protein